MWSGVVVGSCLLFWVLLHHHNLWFKGRVVLFFFPDSCNLSSADKMLLKRFQLKLNPFMQSRTFVTEIFNKCNSVKSTLITQKYTDTVLKRHMKSTHSLKKNYLLLMCITCSSKSPTFVCCTHIVLTSILILTGTKTILMSYL